MDLKKCFKCYRELPISDFYAHPAMADGRIGKCKSCTKSDVREHRHKHIDEIHAYDRWRYQNHPQRKECFLRRQRELRDARDPRPSARTAVSNAIRDGRLTRMACEVCGTTLRVEAHHDDYTKPLDVRWLCFKHHREIAHGQKVTA